MNRNTDLLLYFFVISLSNYSLYACDNSNNFEQVKIKKIIIRECNNLLIIIPKQMGCIACQYYHYISNSTKYKHYLKRKEQLENFVFLLQSEGFSLEEAHTYLTKTIKPFKGSYGKKFYTNCSLLLSDYSDNDK